jgi:hypothetical protein
VRRSAALDALREDDAIGRPGQTDIAREFDESSGLLVGSLHPVGAGQGQMGLQGPVVTRPAEALQLIVEPPRQLDQ